MIWCLLAQMFPLGNRWRQPRLSNYLRLQIVARAHCYMVTHAAKHPEGE